MLHIKFKLKFTLIVFNLLLLILFSINPLYAQQAKPDVRVAVRTCPPFVINDNGQYSGISIFLLDNIAEQLGVSYSLEHYELEEMLEAVVQGKADIAVSCLSITKEREKILDFSHSFY